MNATGQLLIGPALTPWEGLTDAEVTRLMEAGTTALHPVVGLIEFPLFIDGLPKDRLYLYSVEGPKLSTLTRLMARSERWAPEITTGKRLADFPESALAMALTLGPSGRTASRAGWGSFVVSGCLAQGDDPALFQGIFYEISLDASAETCVILPTSTARHYAAGDLAQASTAEARKMEIWGFEEDPFPLLGATES